jgi:2-polyprenyl-3-methyl-5-hydroxy-6-metoxy-1,4-benzoquinol methylase
MSLKDNLLEQTIVYSLWQAPFAAEKMAPILKHNDLRSVRRVLDVGCGPGTNTQYFADPDYLGIDINPGYIDSARRKHKRAFVAVDVTAYEDGSAGKFDFILVNSFLHHISDADAHKILSRLAELLTPDGHLHIVELVSPGDRSIAQLLANWDRGKYLRRLEKWRDLFEKHMNIVVFESYPIKLAGTTLWNLVYCKGYVNS